MRCVKLLLILNYCIYVILIIFAFISWHYKFGSHQGLFIIIHFCIMLYNERNKKSFFYFLIWLILTRNIFSKGFNLITFVILPVFLLSIWYANHINITFVIYFSAICLDPKFVRLITNLKNRKIFQLKLQPRII